MVKVNFVLNVGDLVVLEVKPTDSISLIKKVLHEKTGN